MTYPLWTRQGGCEVRQVGKVDVVVGVEIQAGAAGAAGGGVHPGETVPKAGEELMSKLRVQAHGRALCWEELDDDLSIDDILAGRWLE